MGKSVVGRKRNLKPLLDAIELASKFGFISKSVWDEQLCSGKQNWRNKSWSQLTRSKIFREIPEYGLRNQILTLTSLGKKLANSNGFNPVDVPWSKTYLHDEILIKLILRIRSTTEVLWWKTENEIRLDHSMGISYSGRSQQGKFMDLLVSFGPKSDPLKIAFELERTRKHYPRYLHLVSAFREMSQVDGVIILCEEKAIEEAIGRALIQTQFPTQQKPFFFAATPEIIANPMEGILRFEHGSTTLSQLLNGTAQGASDIGTIPEQVVPIRKAVFN